MDIKAKVEEILEKVKGDEGFLAKFKEDPIKAIEEIIGVDLPDEQLKAIVEGVKAKLSLDKDGDGKLDIVENIEEKAGDIVGDLGEKAEGIGDKIKDTVGGLGDKAGDLKDKVGDAAGDLGEKAGDIGDKIKDTVGGIGEKLGGIFKKD